MHSWMRWRAGSRYRRSRCEACNCQLHKLVLRGRRYVRCSVQMLGEWAGLPQSWEGSKPQRPQPFNLSVPYKCHATTTPSQMACLLSHLFTIFSAWQAGLVRGPLLCSDVYACGALLGSSKALSSCCRSRRLLRSAMALFCFDVRLGLLWREQA